MKITNTDTHVELTAADIKEAIETFVRDGLDSVSQPLGKVNYIKLNVDDDDRTIYDGEVSFYRKEPQGK